MSPDMLASAFAKTDEAKRMRHISSYRMANGAAGAVSARDWDNVTLSLDQLEEDIPKGKAGYARWRHESVRCLPQGVFVWLDEFERSFKSDFSQDNWIGDDREERASLDLSPLLAPGKLEFIMEGFDTPASKCFIAPEAPTPPTINANAPLCHEEKEPNSPAAPTPSVNANNTTPVINPEPWEDIARSIGETWMLEQIELAKNSQNLDWQNDKAKSCPGVNAIARYVEGELSNRNITGRRGKYLDANTIKREALAGITGRHRTGKS
jgi:hypothetical protein